MCKNPTTVISRDSVSRLFFVNCEACGCRYWKFTLLIFLTLFYCSRSVAQIQKGFHATARGERRAARNK